MTSLCIMKRGSNEIFSFPLACPIEIYINNTYARQLVTQGSLSFHATGDLYLSAINSLNKTTRQASRIGDRRVLNTLI